MESIGDRSYFFPLRASNTETVSSDIWVKTHQMLLTQYKPARYAHRSCFCVFRCTLIATTFAHILQGYFTATDYRGVSESTLDSMNLRWMNLRWYIILTKPNTIRTKPYAYYMGYTQMKNSMEEMATAELSSYPGYFREPHWKSMGLPEISRLTWQDYDCYTVMIPQNMHSTA